MNRVFIPLLLTMGIANAVELAKVAEDLKTYDDHVAQLTAAFEENSLKPEDKEWVKAKLSHMAEVDQYMRKYTSIPFEHAYTDAEKLEFNKQFMPQHLDDRRKEVGLSTEAEYIKMFKEICH